MQSTQDYTTIEELEGKFIERASVSARLDTAGVKRPTIGHAQASIGHGVDKLVWG